MTTNATVDSSQPAADPPPYRSDAAATRFVDGNNTRFAYRRFGPAGDTPLVMCMRFKGTMDHWDPAFLQVLSGARDVIIFDNVGIGATLGSTPTTVDAMADGALDFVDALDLPRLDLLGWSMGGFIVQAATLRAPERVRRLVVAGSGPGQVPNMPPTPGRVLEIMAKQETSDDDYLYLFFPETDDAREAGIASLRRLDTRLSVSNASVTDEVGRAQLAAVTAFGTGVWDRLADFKLPVLVANGAHDVMINSVASYAMSQRLPNATVVLYSDAGHAFLFQHPRAFGEQVVEFLR
jgi:pimeloyl-ACP methyl ester carboxylesterase